MADKLWRIGIDGNEANSGRRVGSNVYAHQLLCALEKLTGEQPENFEVTVFLSSQAREDLPLERDGWHYRVLKPGKLMTQWALPLYLFLHQKDFDVFYTPGHYAPRLCAVPYVSSVMDLAFLKYPDLFRSHDLYQLSNWTRYSVKRASKIITISRFSKREIVKAYKRRPADIVVAYPAFADEVMTYSRNEQRRVLKELSVGNHYFLYLGTLQPRKNILRMIEAFEIFVKRNFDQDWQLVLAGKNGWLTDEITDRIEKSPQKTRIVVTGFVDDKQKSILLANATATLNLGIYEGFGIPALESLAYGVLPIVANNTSLPEVIGNAGFSVNPFRVQSIVKAFNYAADFPTRQRQRFVRLARRQSAKFSYEASAQEVLKTLVKVAEQSS